MLGEIGRLVTQMGAYIAALEMATQNNHTEIEQLKKDKADLQVQVEKLRTEIDRANTAYATAAVQPAEAALNG